MIDKNIYIIPGNLMVGASNSKEDKISFLALIMENESIPNEAVVLAIKMKNGNEELFKHITYILKSQYFDKILKTELPLHDLPLYVGWEWKTPEFTELLKKGLR